MQGIRHRVFYWLVRVAGLKMYTLERTITRAEIKAISLNSAQYDRFEKIVKNKMRKELSENLPVMFVKSTNHKNSDIKLYAHIWALPINKKFEEAYK